MASCLVRSDEACSVRMEYDEVLLRHGYCTMLGECGEMIGRSLIMGNEGKPSR